MTTSTFSPSVVGWTAIVTGVTVILAVIFLILMYTVNGRFGTVNDVLNAMIGILSVALAWMLYAEHHARSPLVSQIGLILVAVGAIFTIVGSILIIFRFTDFVLAGWYTGVGNALIGLWLVAFCYSMLNSDVLTHSLVVFGIVTGAFMAMGFLGIPGILARVDTMESLPWYLGVGYFGFLGTYVLYPIWTIWFGRILLLR
ncbi:hypothetical protein ANAEL_03485 [Anaerolineales bacterium]|nr:hypothetical protein ANAEL_03485 [Anaerolineales bacterium]